MKTLSSKSLEKVNGGLSQYDLQKQTQEFGDLSNEVMNLYSETMNMQYDTTLAIIMNIQ